METWPLRDALILSTRAVLLALSLEERGHGLTAKEGTLLVGNGSALTPEDRHAIKQDRFQLLAIAGYTPPA